MRHRKRALIDILAKQWLLIGSVSSLLALTAYIGRPPKIGLDDLKVLFLLFALFVTVKGLETGRVFEKISPHLGNGRFTCLKLTLITFFSSMIFTNDAALVMAIPLTLAMDIENKPSIIILQCLSANAGSAFTPFGNPQNLYIYWHYHLHPLEFFYTIVPFCMVFLILIAICALYLEKSKNKAAVQAKIRIHKKAIFYLLANGAVILAIFRLLPISWLAVMIFFTVLFDPACLEIDYSLLVTMLCFLGISEDMKTMFQPVIEHSTHIFLLSALSSQLISNVPAAFLFAKFTSNWRALLWGTSVGGFGGLIGSLANLIAYRLYVSSLKNGGIRDFTLRFVLANYAFFFIGMGLFYLVKPYIFP